MEWQMGGTESFLNRNNVLNSSVLHSSNRSANRTARSGFISATYNINTQTLNLNKTSEV
jgi:hypothetical protein